MLVAERERHQRIHAGIPDGAVVALSLVRLPKGAPIFPATLETGEFLTGLATHETFQKGLPAAPRSSASAAPGSTI